MSRRERRPARGRGGESAAEEDVVVVSLKDLDGEIRLGQGWADVISNSPDVRRTLHECVQMQLQRL